MFSGLRKGCTRELYLLHAADHRTVDVGCDSRWFAHLQQALHSGLVAGSTCTEPGASRRVASASKTSPSAAFSLRAMARSSGSPKTSSGVFATIRRWQLQRVL